MVEAYIHFNKAEKLEIYDGKGNTVLTAGPVLLDGNLVRQWTIADGEGYLWIGESHIYGSRVGFVFDWMTGDFNYPAYGGQPSFTLPMELRDLFFNTIEEAIASWRPLQQKYALAFPSEEQMFLNQLDNFSGEESQRFVQWLVKWKRSEVLNYHKEWKQQTKAH